MVAIELKPADLRVHIVGKFNGFLREIQTPYHPTPSLVYAQAFQYAMICEDLGFFPQEAVALFDELTRLLRGSPVALAQGGIETAAQRQAGA